MNAHPSRKCKEYGFVEWFRPGQHERTQRSIDEMAAAGASWVRTHLSWAEYVAPGGQEWFDWLFPRISARLEVLPCIHYTPPSISRTGKTSGAPERLRDYADFVDVVLTRWGEHFSHVELWNEPNNLLDWDWREDPDYLLFCEMIGDAAHWVRHRGWKPVLAAPSPFDPQWVELMGERGLIGLMAAVGMHGFPGTWDSEASHWQGWERHLRQLRAIVSRYSDDCEVWITEAGYSTWRADEIEQAARFEEALMAGADRMYWYSWRDVPHDVAVQEGLWFDSRHYHLGAVGDSGQKKLLARFLQEGGLPRVAEMNALSRPSLARRRKPVVITGGAGFIGSNLADSFLQDGVEVLVIDNLCRPGVERNMAWLGERHGERLHTLLCDVRDTQSLAPALAEAAAVFHLAGQTAVTTSLESPTDDFEINLRGTLNVLEAVRRTGRNTPVIFASTNKVYGSLSDIEMSDGARSHVPADNALRRRGVPEERPLDFCTPYGCSKGAADQYVLDYAKSWDIPTAVLRMSCVYGPRQLGTEDQGWVAHFLMRALAGEPITVFGDGRQVRDVLHVSDAVAAYRSVLANIAGLSGEAFNLGGGPSNAVSLRQVLAEIAVLTGRQPEVSHAPWRTGDQPWFVADTSRLTRKTGWRARVAWREGLRDLAGWLRAEAKRTPAARREARAVA